VDRFGISAALLTPFDDKGALDATLFIRHMTSVLAQGADGVTLFGTTGEGASIGFDERLAGLDLALGSGIPAERIVMGVCATSVADAADQVGRALDRGIRDFLLLPPFYFKGCSDSGLFDWHAALFARSDPRARFIIYHIPQVTGVPLSLALVGRLAAAFPERILAIKDSSGDWQNAEALLLQKALPVLIGDERLLHRGAALGGAGAITGMANLYPARMKRLFETATEDTALSGEVTRIVSGPVIPALKAILAAREGEPGWEHLRPPLEPLDAAARQAVLGRGTEVA
jgi:4-hydroxy-tetrahydrodipicolinate synthase